jgi:hypothetical protein
LLTESEYCAFEERLRQTEIQHDRAEKRRGTVRQTEENENASSGAKKLRPTIYEIEHSEISDKFPI